jgi:hypothetical protein
MRLGFRLSCVTVAGHFERRRGLREQEGRRLRWLRMLRVFEVGDGERALVSTRENDHRTALPFQSGELLISQRGAWPPPPVIGHRMPLTP